MIDRHDAEKIARMNAPEPERHSSEWLKVKSNNFGFLCKHDYPYSPVPRNQRFIVGVFGGSIALYFCMQQGQAFAEKMARNLGGGCTVELLNFGIGAFKQPQPTFVLAYFLMLGQCFDAVVLIDGFNDAALSWVNQLRGIACSFPSLPHMEMFSDILPHYEFKRQAQVSPPHLISEIASVWSEGARLMRTTCNEYGIPFYHVLQPNQYFSRKTFSEEERRIALSETTPYREGVCAVYPELVRRFSEMRQAGLNAFDATAIFDDRIETVYSDNCCHYNRLGNEILGEFILKSMIQSGFARNSPDRTRARDIVTSLRRLFSSRKAIQNNIPKMTKPFPGPKDDLYPMW